MTEKTQETGRLSEAVQRLNTADRVFVANNLRPKDAATLLILDRAAGGPVRVLMGRRHMRHKFFPGAYVFPGGRVDPMDSRTPLADDFDPLTRDKLAAALKGPKTAARVRAFGVAAIRETYEEAGFLIGRRPEGGVPALKGELAAFSERGLLPGLGALRFVARAITPPRRPRRFDTRFLACFAGDVADRTADGLGPSGELEDVAWLTFEEAKKTEIPPITVTILDEIAHRLESDPGLDPTGAVPFYYWLGKGFRRVLI
ncbi:NUDIX hydrolase [Prosthecomicrobium sp. N25]|uniref:NUDIX hydrolase n=1 Tax=Prosthecomicrobium sp. N25 TaxID=3129254 RepID=UPI0030785BA4